MNDLVITLDLDWAPDFVIDFVAEHLITRRVRATWFVTHSSPAVDRLRLHPDLFELGIHPNFMAHSTHGNEPEAVLDHCMHLVPQATSMRTHGLMQSFRLLALVLEKTRIRTDLSLFLPHMPSLQPIEFWWDRKLLWRIPYFWEDDLEMERPTPAWLLAAMPSRSSGLRALNFHPIHIYLNSATMENYRRLRQHALRTNELTRQQVEPYVTCGQGTQSFFMEVVDHLAANGRSHRIRDVIAAWEERKIL